MTTYYCFTSGKFYLLRRRPGNVIIGVGGSLFVAAEAREALFQYVFRFILVFCEDILDTIRNYSLKTTGFILLTKTFKPILLQVVSVQWPPNWLSSTGYGLFCTCTTECIPAENM